ncbi:FAD-dependent oxidoreductase [Aerococcaceae bacterium DSM 111020]|nr:FAD-dependent oxidoreductase [Aerococcaceae bacterium DSM 111020]
MKIIIIGGSFAGIQAAMTCREMDQDCEIIILEASDDLLFYPVEFRSRLVSEPTESFTTEKNNSIDTLIEQRIECYLNTYVTHIQPDKKSITCKRQGIIEQFHYDYLILAMGSQQSIGITDVHINERIISLDSQQSLKDSLSLVGQAEKIMIIGGGQYGIEMSELYLTLGKQVTLLEAGEHLAFKLFDHWMMKDLQNDLLHEGLILKCNESYQSVTLRDEALSVKSHRNQYQTDIIQFAMNVEPNTKIVEDILRFNPDGTIWTDAFLETSQSSIYACGDLIKWRFGQQNEEYYLPLISHAKLSGRIVGMNIFGNKHKLPNSPRAIAMTILDYDYFSCGKTLQELKYSQVDYHLSRYQSEGLFIQCLSQIDTGEILGVQIRGLKKLHLSSLFSSVLIAMQAGLTDYFLAVQMNVYQGHQALLPDAWFDAINQHYQGRQRRLQAKERYHAD